MSSIRPETNTKPKVLAIVGPTASGKTSLGIYLAQKVRGEIISADSRQVYKGLTIGTGKVTKKEMEGVPHHLLDVVSPKKQFTVADFVQSATHCIAGITAKGRVPLVVGGTGLYTDMLLGRMHYPNVPPNPALRKLLEKKTPAKLFAQLKKLDPRRAASIEPHHARRLIRAIEIAKAIGESPTTLPPAPYQVLWLGINPAPERLKKNIHSRLVSRIQAGMVNEAKRLHVQGLTYKRMDALGLEYRYMAQLLTKKITPAQFAEDLERAIWQYSKRQKRWFARNKDIVWVRNKTEALRLSKKFLNL